MSNPLKGVGKVFKKVAKTLKPLVKPLAIAAAIYFTGAALGAWGAGAATGSTGAAGTIGSTGIGGATAGAGSGLGLAAEGGNISAAMGGAEAATAGLSAAAPSTTGLTAGLTAKGATAGLATAPATTVGTLKGAGKAILGFMEKNPATTMIAGQALASAFTPTASEEAIKMDQYRRQHSTYYGTGQSGGPGIETGRLAEVTGGFVPGGQPPAPGQPVAPGALSQYTGAV